MNEADSDSAPISDDGLPLFLRTVGAFLLGCGIVIAAVTWWTAPTAAEIDADPEGYYIAVSCDIGATLLGVGVLFAVVSGRIAHENAFYRARGWWVGVALGATYQMIPYLVLGALADATLSPDLRRMIVLTTWAYRFAAPVFAAMVLLVRVR